MYMTFRWFGPDDPVPLEHIRQIPGIRSVVSALHELPPGAVWPLDRLRGLRSRAEAADLAWRVVESIPVSEAIKLAMPERDRDIEHWILSLRNVAEALGPASLVQNGQYWSGRDAPVVVTYNFMPVFDWTRSELERRLPDGSTCLAYDQPAIERMDPLLGELELPGWLARYSRPELERLLGLCRTMDGDRLFDNLLYFLAAVCPEAERLGLVLALHPDDPPWPVFGIPRVVTGTESLARLFDRVPSPANGLCLCTGSFASDPENGVAAMIDRFPERLAFMHMRNIKITGKRCFEESAHPSACGSVDMAAAVAALVRNGFSGPVRPDHGRMIWGERGKPGYGLFDRALGAMYLQGLFEMSGYVRESGGASGAQAARAGESRHGG